MSDPGAGHRLDRSAPTALWRQLRDDLARRLADGDFAEGFPGEHGLADDYGVSRHTVRLALRELRDSGAVSAARGQAPRVLRPVVEQPWTTLSSLFAEVETTGRRQQSVVHELEERTDPVAAGQLGLREDTALVYLHRTRLADDAPFAQDRVWLPARLARPLLDALLAHQDAGNTYELDSLFLLASTAALFSTSLKEKFLELLPNRIITDSIGSSETGFGGTSVVAKGQSHTGGPRVTIDKNTKVLDENGKLVTVTMGSYGVGVTRAVGVVAEDNHDELGLVWPREVAPFDVHVVAAGKGEDLFVAAGQLAADLEAQGLDVLYDDRAGKVSPGVKFKDAELIGVPTTVVIGRGLADGELELKDRATGEARPVPVDGAVAAVLAEVRDGR